MQRQTARQELSPPDPVKLASELTVLCRSLAGLCESAARRALRRGEWDYLLAVVPELSSRVRQYGFAVADGAAQIAELRTEITELKAQLAAGARQHPARRRRGQGHLWPVVVLPRPRSLPPPPRRRTACA